MHEGSETILGENPREFQCLRGRRRERKQQRLIERGKERRYNHGNQERREFQEEHLVMPYTAERTHKISSTKRFPTKSYPLDFPQRAHH